MVSLYPYQKELCADVLTFLGEGGRGTSAAVRLPTGGGKTVIAGAILKKFMEEFPTRANAWVTHRTELRDQSGESLKKMFKLRVSDMRELGPNERTWRPGYVNMISPQMRKMPRIPKLPGLMVVDEGHHSPAPTWAKKIDAWRDAGGLVVGFSATWWRASRKQGFEQWYDELFLGPDFPDLEGEGYLAEPHLWSPQRAQMDTSEMRMLGTGDYNVADIETEAMKLLAQKPVVETWIEHTEDLDDKRTLWFCPTHLTADALREHIEGMTGDRTAVLLGDTPKIERRRLLQRLRDGKIVHLISVDVLGEGVDIPSVPVIATIRSTASIAVWLQQSGRGSRPKAEDGGHYILLDFASNAANLGMPNAPREWYLEPRDTRPSGDGGGFTARCFSSECEDIQLHPSHKECWNCGEEMYEECNSCHDDRRWTKFSHSKSHPGTCVICVDALKEYEAAQQRKKYQKSKNKKAQEFKFKRPARDEAEKVVNPADRGRKGEQDRMAEYMSTLRSHRETGMTAEEVNEMLDKLESYTEDSLF